MGFIRKRANGTLAYVFMWKGKRHTKNLDHFIRVLGNRRVATLTDADMESFHRKREKESAGRPASQTKKASKSKKSTQKQTARKRLVSQGKIRADLKSFKAAINWAISRKPPLLKV